MSPRRSGDRTDHTRGEVIHRVALVFCCASPQRGPLSILMVAKTTEKPCQTKTRATPTTTIATEKEDSGLDGGVVLADRAALSNAITWLRCPMSFRSIAGDGSATPPPPPPKPVMTRRGDG